MSKLIEQSEHIASTDEILNKLKPTFSQAEMLQLYSVVYAGL